MKKGREKKFIKLAVLAGIVLMIAAGAVFAFTLPGMSKVEKIKAVNGAVTIPLSKVSDGKAHFYKFTDGGKDIGVFVVKAPDDSVKTAFDACDVCYREKKGYFQEGDFMVCRNCNKRFATVRIGPHAVGGCNPSYLPHQQVTGNVVIREDDIKAGARYF